MSEEFIRERLFKPFETTKSAGMGIGVFESREYITGTGRQRWKWPAARRTAPPSHDVCRCTGDAPRSVETNSLKRNRREPDKQTTADHRRRPGPAKAAALEPGRLRRAWSPATARRAGAGAPPRAGGGHDGPGPAARSGRRDRRLGHAAADPGAGAGHQGDRADRQPGPRQRGARRSAWAPTTSTRSRSTPRCWAW